MSIQAINTLQVVFKIVEKCNLNCSYCYYYTDANVKTNTRPAVISKSNIIAITDFLVKGCEKIKIDNLSIIFHGGEPTLLKTTVFDWMCAHIHERLDGLTNLTFAIQTNGVHLTEEWLRLFEKYRVAIGVSLDGTEEYNDSRRVDHSGMGSYKRIANNITTLNNLSNQKRITPIGIIGVLNHEHDYKTIYRHFVNDLNVKALNFLLPDRNRDSSVEELSTIPYYGDILCNIFDEWLDNGQEFVKIRQFEDFLQNFKGNIKYIRKPDGYIRNQIIVLHTDGHVAVDDTLMPAIDWYRNSKTEDVRNISLHDWLSQETFDFIRKARDSIPVECVDCRWKTVCRGGDLENRFSTNNGFVNKSVYCPALLKFYSHVERSLLESGYPTDRFEQVLDIVPCKVCV